MSESVKPTVVNVSKLKTGWKNDPQYVDVRRMRNGRVNPNVGAAGYFGNRFKLGFDEHGTPVDRHQAVYMFRSYAERKIKTDPTYRDAVTALAGKTLVCCCKPLECHGDVLAELCERLNAEVANV